MVLVRECLEASALTAAPPWRALLPTQTLERASANTIRFPMRTVQNAKSALQTRFPVRTVQNARMLTLSLESFQNLGSARPVRDWLMAPMTAFNAPKSWRALIPTQRLESASALKARIPVWTVKNVNAGGTILDCLRAQINAWTARMLVRDPLITNALTATPS